MLAYESTPSSRGEGLCAQCGSCMYNVDFLSQSRTCSQWFRLLGKGQHHQWSASAEAAAMLALSRQADSNSNGKPKEHFLINLAAAALSSSAHTTAFYPIHRVKNILQTQVQHHSANGCREQYPTDHALHFRQPSARRMPAGCHARHIIWAGCKVHSVQQLCSNCARAGSLQPLVRK